MSSNSASASKTPKASAFTQQTLRAWQPILTPKTVLPAFFLIGIIFIPIGIALLSASNSVYENIIDYTNCDQRGPNYENSGSYPDMKYDVANNKCSVLFEVEKDLTGPVYLYYRLSNFYQNHRRYVKSFDTRQLLGKAIDANSLVSDCDPLRTGVRDSDQAVLPIYPCGLIANSFFNDTFSSLSSTSPTAPLTYPWSDKGIAWPSDLNKFRPTEYGPNDVLPPPNWSKYAGGYTQIPALWEDERFLVWMRTAGLPTFRKLWGRSDDDLPAGVYEMVIEDFYPVRSFNGTKSVVISTTSWIGGRNPFLGIAYLAVGSICILVGIIFLIRHVIRPRALGDTAHLSWNKNK